MAFTGTHIHIRDNVPITVGDGCVIDDDPRGALRAGQRPGALLRSATGSTRCATSHRTPRAWTWAPTTTRTSARSATTRSGPTGSSSRTPTSSAASGNDTRRYRNSQGGVTVTLDNQFNDGNRGKENVRSDFEPIEGSNGNDTLTGSNDPNKTEFYFGRAGNDTMSGLDGTDVFNEGPTPSGADTIRGQSGIDRVNYVQRTTPVTVDMASLQRNSGAAGEGDFIDPNTNDAFGGSAGDTMIGGSGANVFVGLRRRGHAERQRRQRPPDRRPEG